jgi:hypothetical protein
MVGKPQPWPASFKRPASVGDILNQDVFSAAEAEIVAPELQVVLPTSELVKAWNR